jgi:hypothetical protein
MGSGLARSSGSRLQRPLADSGLERSARRRLAARQLGAAKEKRSGAGVNPKLRPALPAAALAPGSGGRGRGGAGG